MLCSENPSGSKGCCHTMCCCCKAKGLIPPLLAPLCISRKGIEAAESKPPQSRCGEWVSQVDGCITHSFQLVFPVFLLLSLSRKWNWKTEKKPSKAENTFRFFSWGHDCELISYLLNHYSRHLQTLLRQLLKPKWTTSEWKIKSCFLKKCQEKIILESHHQEESLFTANHFSVYCACRWKYLIKIL